MAIVAPLATASRLRGIRGLRCTWSACSRSRAGTSCRAFGSAAVLQGSLAAAPRWARRAGRASGGAAASSDRLLRLGTFASLGAVVAASAAISSLDHDSENERVWLGDRGPFSSQRAYAILPMCACTGSGVVATIIALRFPGRVKAVSLGPSAHELLGLPLSILLAFRFQGSYDRWWSSRKDLETLTSNIIAVAMSATNDGCEAAYSDVCSAHQLRFLSILDALCVLVDEALMHGHEPHPHNKPSYWPAPADVLSENDAAANAMTHDPVLWCVDTIIDLIRAGHRQGFYTAEEASSMYDRTYSIMDQFRLCCMITKQTTPAPFVVHMRTFLLAFCFTFPFTIISSTAPYLILPIQAVVGFSFMGIEFCSREMEHPFGSDESDVPCRMLLANIRQSIQNLREKHLVLRELYQH